jgi:hypothetical protein
MNQEDITNCYEDFIKQRDEETKKILESCIDKDKHQYILGIIDKLIQSEPKYIQEYYNDTIFPPLVIKSAPELAKNHMLRNPRNALIFIISSRYTKNEDTRRIRNALLWLLQKLPAIRRNTKRCFVASSIIKLSNETNMYGK